MVPLEQDFATIGQLTAEFRQRLEQEMDGNTLQYGIPLGYVEIDRIWRLRRQKLTVLGGPPGVGKSTLALNIAFNVAFKSQATVSFFSLRSDRAWFVERLLSMESGIDAWRLRAKELNEQEVRKLDHALNFTRGLPLFFDDTDELNLVELEKKLQALKLDRGVDLVIIDPVDELQPLQAPTKVKQLKSLAKNLDLAILGLTDQIPSPILKGHRRLEYQADEILVLDREELRDPDNEDKRGTADVYLAKSRGGPKFQVELLYIERTGKFLDLGVYIEGRYVIADDEDPYDDA